MLSERRARPAQLHGGVIAAGGVVRVDAQQVVEVGFEPVPKIEFCGVRMLLDKHRVTVANLREAVDFVLGARGLAGLEHQTQRRAIEKSSMSRSGHNGSLT